jgi:hypothetical protein
MSRGRRAALLVAVAGAAIAAVNGLDLPLTARRLQTLAGGEPLLDLRLGYDLDAIRRLLSQLGASGRSSYLTMLWTVDLVLPALFGVALWVTIGAGSFVRWRRVAVAATAADYSENVAISALIMGYPDLHPSVATLAAVLTAAKFSLYALAAAIALAGFWMTWRAADTRDHASRRSGS